MSPQVWCEFLLRLDREEASGSKTTFTKNTNSVHEQIHLSLKFDFFFVPVLIAMTCLSPS